MSLFLYFIFYISLKFYYHKDTLLSNFVKSFHQCLETVVKGCSQQKEHYFLGGFEKIVFSIIKLQVSNLKFVTRTKYTYLQFKFAVYLAVIKHLYLHHCLLSVSMLIKGYRCFRWGLLD